MHTPEGAFTWGVKQQRAVRLVAADALSDREIAHRCAINTVTLTRWKRLPEFAARVEQFRETMAAEELTGGIADRQRRVDRLQRSLDRLEEIVEERAADVTMRSVPGGATGLLVRQYKMIGLGKNAHQVTEYAVDTATVREMRALMEQAAKELGQWTERRELTGKDGGPVHLDLRSLSDEALDILERARRIIAELDTRVGGDPG